MTNATYTNPRHVATYVRSATHSWFGRTALNCRVARSGGRAAAVSGIVVTANVRPRTTARLAQAPHQAGHRTAGDGLPFTPQLLPDFADAVDLAVLPPHATDVLAQALVPPRPRCPAVGIALPCLTAKQSHRATSTSGPGAASAACTRPGVFGDRT